MLSVVVTNSKKQFCQVFRERFSRRLSCSVVISAVAVNPLDVAGILNFRGTGSHSRNERDEVLQRPSRKFPEFIGGAQAKGFKSKAANPATLTPGFWLRPLREPISVQRSPLVTFSCEGSSFRFYCLLVGPGRFACKPLGVFKSFAEDGKSRSCCEKWASKSCVRKRPCLVGFGIATGRFQCHQHRRCGKCMRC